MINQHIMKEAKSTDIILCWCEGKGKRK